MTTVITALKKSRPIRTLHYLVTAVGLYAKTITTRIHFRRARQDDFICTKALQNRQILIERARVSVEVLGIVELRGVHEDADNRNFVFPPASLYDAMRARGEGLPSWARSQYCAQ